MKNTLVHQYSWLQLLPCSDSRALPTLVYHLFPLSDAGKSPHAQTFAAPHPPTFPPPLSQPELSAGTVQEGSRDL